MKHCPTCNNTFPRGQFCPRDGAELTDAPRELQEGGESGGGDESDPMVGTVIADRFRIISRLGIGGMGAVYEAKHRYINKRVALKMLHAEIIKKPEALARFQREALSASTIGHKNIIAIDDFGRLDDGRVYLTMELLDGTPLNRALQDESLSLEQILDVAIQICHGLAAAHAKGIVHRDMKPENIFLVGDEHLVKILDFGIAKVSRTDNQNTNLTKTGVIFGTPNYMAPEQALGKKTDHRTDIYAVGVILYEMMTGKIPFTAESFLAVLTQHVTKPPVPPSEVTGVGAVPASLERIILRAMEKDPDDRFQEMRELIEALMEVRRAECAARDLPSHLGLEQIMPPVSALYDLDELSQIDAAGEEEGPGHPTGPGQGQVTATEGELVEARSPPRRRRGFIVALMIGSVLIGGGGVVAYVQLRQSSDHERPPAATTESPRAEPAGGPPAAPEEPPEAPREPAARANQVNEKPLVVHFTSKPAGADIFIQGRRIGRTPRSVELPRGEVRQVFYELRNHKAWQFMLETSKVIERQVIYRELEKISRKRKKRRPGKKTKPKRRHVEAADEHGGHPGPRSDHAEHESTNKGPEAHDSHDQ